MSGSGSSKVYVLNTGGTFSQRLTLSGTLDIIPESLPEVSEKVLEILSERFRDECFEVLLITDAIFDFVWDNYHQLERKLLDSSAMTPMHWNLLADITAHLGSKSGSPVVIIHGTDSLAFTAAALSFMIKSRNFPIVITGSQFPLSTEKNDAERNLVDAVSVSLHKDSEAGPMNGVHVCFYGKIMRGVHVVKISSIIEDAFNTPRFQPVGCVGNLIVTLTPQYIERLWANQTTVRPQAVNSYALTQRGAVMIVKIHPGIDLSFLSYTAAANQHMKAVLLMGLGSGNGPTDEDTNNVLVSLLDKGCFIVVGSDCLDGRASNTYASCLTSIDKRILAAENMTTEAAYAKMLIAIGTQEYPSLATFKKKMESSWCGEHTPEITAPGSNKVC